MLKTISAALLAVSVLAVAPAMAAGHGRTTHAPVQGRCSRSRACSTPMPGWAAITTGIRHHHHHKHIGMLTTTPKFVIKHGSTPGVTETDPRARFDPHCPAAPRGYQARPARHCFPNGGRAGPFSAVQAGR